MAVNTTSNGLLRLPHFTSSKRAMDLHEPIFQNRYAVTLMPPAGLKTDEAEVNIVLEGVQTVSGLNVQLGTTPVTTNYKLAEAQYASQPGQTHLELSIEFQLHALPGQGTVDNYTFKFLRRWFDLIHDPLTGRQSIKADYAAPYMIITLFDRRDVPYWQWVCYNVWPSAGLNGPTLNYKSTDVLNETITFQADYCDETIL